MGTIWRAGQKAIATAAALLCTAALASAPGTAQAQAPGDVNLPHLQKQNGRFAMVVDGKPYFMFGAQINNSSSWASTLPDVWPAYEALHANTVEAPVYWEQMEPEPGRFDFSNVDLLVNGARQHHLHLVLLWFGTWKNGQNHYVPEWMKRDTVKYPRERSAYGKVLDVMSPHAEANLEADKHAFAALMHHLRETDSAEHTVIMIQVENESGAIGTIRDHTEAADRAFAGQVPAAALHTRKGTWSEVYGADADERFAAYSTAHYIGEVAKAGKAEYPLPMYCNVWITYPVHALANRDRASAGQEYPSGGPQQANIDIWKAAAPAIDVLGPDFYSNDRQLFRDVVATYGRPDNAFFVPETHIGKDFGANLFFSIGHGAIGFSPFGVDFTKWTLHDKIPELAAGDYALLQPMASEIAEWNLQGKLQTAVERKGEPAVRLQYGPIEAVVGYGFPQRDGEEPPGTTEGDGRALIAQLGPDEFVVTGMDASVTFEPHDPAKQVVEVLKAEEGSYKDGQWQMTRIWNGDQTDRGLQFRAGNPYVVRIRLLTLPAYPASR